jgi:hypothetical protein
MQKKLLNNQKMSASKQSPTKLLEKLDQIYQNAKSNFENKHQNFVDWMKSNNVSYDDLKNISQQVLAATSLAGWVALNNPPTINLVQEVKALEKPHDELLASVSQEEHHEIIKKINSIVQMPPGHMDKETELYLEQQLSDMLGFEVTAELDNHRLNHSIGIMGGEQHIRRFPGDTLSQHDAFLEAGLAPNRGAFGWFTQNGELSNQAIMREKYYFAVQTLYLPDWNSSYQTLKPWYKFRKMIVVNPAEKIAVVGVVGDAGPASWVQKQFGGSPEVIREGKIWSLKTRGRVLLLFVDDPENKVKLGTISLEYQNTLKQEG